MRLGGGRRRLSRSVALLVLVTLALGLFVAPAFAGPVTPGGVTDPPGTDVTNPPPDSSSTSSTTTSSTTTTTKPRKKPTKKPDAKHDDAKPATPTDATPTAGPPELPKAGVLLPDDSVQAAVEELTLERAKVDLIGRRRTEIESSILEHENKLDDVRKETKHEQQQRQDRAGRDLPGSVVGLVARRRHRPRAGRGARGVPRRRRRCCGPREDQGPAAAGQDAREHAEARARRAGEGRAAARRGRPQRQPAARQARPRAAARSRSSTASSSTCRPARARSRSSPTRPTSS